MSTTHGLFDLAELLELLAQSLVIGMPRKTSVRWSVIELRIAVRFDLPYEELRHGELKEH